MNSRACLVQQHGIDSTNGNVEKLKSHLLHCMVLSYNEQARMKSDLQGI